MFYLYSVLCLKFPHLPHVGNAMVDNGEKMPGFDWHRWHLWPVNSSGVFPLSSGSAVLKLSGISKSGYHPVCLTAASCSALPAAATHPSDGWWLQRRRGVQSAGYRMVVNWVQVSDRTPPFLVSHRDDYTHYLPRIITRIHQRLLCDNFNFTKLAAL